MLENCGCFPKFEQGGSKIDIAQRTSKSENPVFIEETLSKHFVKNQGKIASKHSIHRRNIV